MKKNYLKEELYDLVKKDSSIFEFIQKGSLDGIWYWDLEKAKNEWMSPDFWLNLGYNPQKKKHLASEWQNIIFPEDRDAALELFTKHCVDPSIPYDTVVRYYHKDGSIVWIRCRGMVIRDPEGKPMRMLGAHTNITEIKESQREYQSLFDKMINGFILHDVIFEKGVAIDFRFLSVNPAFERIMNISSKEVMGRTMKQIMPNMLEFWLRVYEDLTKSLALPFYEQFCVSEQKYISISAYQPAPGRVACIFSDISPRIMAEKHREELKEKLAQAEKMEAIGQLAGGIAHDFNNQLTGILGYCDLLSSQINDPLLATYIQAIIDSAENSTGLIKQLLTFSRKGQAQMQEINVYNLVTQVLKILERSINKNITIHTHHEVSPTQRIMGDLSLIQNALLNLTLNSRDAMKEGGVISIKSTITTLSQEDCDKSTINCKPGEFLSLAVSDTGVGIDQELCNKIFEPFFTTKDTGKGTGMGLAAVYGTVEKHKGRIKVDSTPDKGTVIEICFPLEG